MRCALLGLVMLAGCGEVASRPADDGGGIDAGPAAITFTSQLGNGQPANTDLVAFQDGDGPWRVAAGVAGVYTATVASSRFGVLAACKRASDGAAFVDLGYYAVSDGVTRYGVSFCSIAQPARVTISGTVAGAAMTEQIYISDGASSSEGPPASWSLPASAGAGTLIAMRLSSDRPVGMLLQHVQFAAGAMFALDFAQQFFPAESDLTLDPTGDMPFMETLYVDEAGGTHRIDTSSTAVTKYRVVPADRVGNGISLLYATGAAPNTSRSIQRAFKSPVAQTLTLPTAYLLPAPPRITATAPHPIIEVALPVRPGALYYDLNYNAFPPSGKFQVWDVIYSAAWVDAVGGSVLNSALPDLSMLPGWIADFALATTGSRAWSVSVVTGPGRVLPGSSVYSAPGQPAAPPVDGEETTGSTSNGMFP